MEVRREGRMSWGWRSILEGRGLIKEGVCGRYLMASLLKFWKIDAWRTAFIMNCIIQILSKSVEASQLIYCSTMVLNIGTWILLVITWVEKNMTWFYKIRFSGAELKTERSDPGKEMVRSVKSAYHVAMQKPLHKPSRSDTIDNRVWKIIWSIRLST